MHLIFSMSFHGLTAHFFLVLNNIPLSGCTTVYAFTYSSISWLFSEFGGYSCNEHLCSGLCVDISFQVLWVHTLGCNCWITFSFVRKGQTVFQSGNTILHFSPAINESSYCSTFLLALGVVSDLDFSNFNMCVVVAHCFVFQ